MNENINKTLAKAVVSATKKAKRSRRVFLAKNPDKTIKIGKITR